MADVLRRLRRTPALRRVFRETRWHADQLIWPIFVQDGIQDPRPIPSLPGQFRWPVGALSQLAAEVWSEGLRSVLVFGLPAEKSPAAAVDPDGIAPRAVRALRSGAPELTIFTDVCVCSFSPNGHCGIPTDGGLDHAATARLLGEIALSHARAGADIVAPSSMVDGQVAAIRTALDAAGAGDTPIMAYSAKFASAFYGPFREAADSRPATGDRKSYQHDPANARHALREMAADAAEGADILMVKPGLPYLDIVASATQAFSLPIAVYQVSGEYAMIEAAAQLGWLDRDTILDETTTAVFRAGADLLITYFARDLVRRSV